MIVALGLILVTSFTVALSGALMPGPLFTVCVADSARRGFSTGPLLILGHAILELALVGAVLLGLGPVLKLPAVMGGTALLGGLILLWMGAGMLRSAGGMTLAVSAEAPDASGAGGLIVTGVLASLSNPYWIIWWATIGLGYLTSGMKYGIAGVAVFFAGHIAADFSWYAAISYSISRGRAVFNDRIYRIVIRACGAGLLAFAVWFLVSALRFFGKF
jgi:threonine/homoserine/homoserine lactone efflux protein